MNGTKLYKVVLMVSNWGMRGGSNWTEEVWAYTMDDAAKKAISECPYKVTKVVSCETLVWNSSALGKGV